MSQVNEYAEAKQEWLKGGKEIIKVTASVRHLGMRQGAGDSNIFTLIKNWVRTHNIAPLFPGDPCNIAFFRTGTMRLSLLVMDGFITVGLFDEIRTIEYKHARERLSETRAQYQQQIQKRRNDSDDDDSDCVDWWDLDDPPI